MKPEYLYSIATDLGLQFDSESRVMYGDREGFLLVIEGTQTKNVFAISVSVKPGAQGDLIEENEAIWQDLKSQSKVINAVSFDEHLVKVGVKGGMSKKKTVESLWNGSKSLSISCTTINLFKSMPLQVRKVQSACIKSETPSF